MAAGDLAQLVAANRERGGRHSPLYAWMRARHDTLAAAIDADGASWRTIAVMLVRAGLTDGTGKPPTAERARKCWHQVRKDVAAARAKAEGKRKPNVSFAPAATAPLPSPVSHGPRPANRPVDDVSPPVHPATGDDGDPLARLRRTLKERSGRS